MTQYPDLKTKQLIKALASLQTEKEIENFLRDLLTLAEIEEFSKRFEIARLLWSTNLSYAKIAAKVKTSTTTVTRVAHWLDKENLKGYQTALKRMFPKK